MDLKQKLDGIRTACKDLSNQEDSKEVSDSNDICPICHGMEWVLKEIDGVEVAVPCKCREKSVMIRKKRFADIPIAFKDIHLKTFSLSVYKTEQGKEKGRIACRIIKKYLDSFDEAKKEGMGLYIYSKSKGSGKTRMAASIANDILENHKASVKFSTSINILNEIKRTYGHESDITESQLVSDLVMADVLIIDDFGTEKVTDWARNKFYDIINQRYINKRIMIFTSNESLDSIQYDDRITSRIKETCYQVDFPEECVRDYIFDENMEKMK